MSLSSNESVLDGSLFFTGPADIREMKPKTYHKPKQPHLVRSISLNTPNIFLKKCGYLHRLWYRNCR